MCDCLCALAPATPDAITVFAKNSDRPPSEPQAIERFDPRHDTSPVGATHIEVEPVRGTTLGFVASRPRWMWGVEHGVNDAGVAIGNETIYTTLDPRPFPDALLGMDLVRLGLERAASAFDAIEVMTDLLERYGQGGTGHDGARRPYWSSFLVADPVDAYVLETSGTTWECEAVERTRAISNRTTIASFDAEHRHPEQPVERLVDPRLAASRAVLAAEPVSVAALAAHLRSHVGGADGWTVCMHVDGVEATTASVIATLPNGGTPIARFLLGSPCRSLYVPVVVGHPLGEVPLWERFAALEADHRPLLDELEATLEAAVDTDDPAWNTYAWAEVEALLDRLGV